jgi:hypothetical protein
VYDARRGEYLGHGKEFALRFTPEMLASVSAVLPYRVQGLAVSADSAAVDQGNTLQCRVEVRTDGPKPGRHVIRVDALGPDGVVSGVHSQNLTMEKGEGAIVFRTARNEPVGRWRLVLRDMATGTRAERPVEVTERKD